MQKFEPLYLPLIPSVCFVLAILAETLVSPHLNFNEGIFVTTVEVILACWISLRIAFRKTVLPRWYALIPALVAMGDLAYGLSNYVLRLHYPNTVKCLVYIVPYFVALILLSLVLGRTLRRLLCLDRSLLVILVIIFVGISYLTVRSIIVPALFFKIPKLSNFLVVLTILFSFLESFVTAAAATLLIGATFGVHQLFLLGLLSMHISDLAIRYQSVHPALLGINFFEYGWCFGILLILTAILQSTHCRSVSLKKSWSPLLSLRGLILLSSFMSLITFWILLLWLYKIPVDVHSAAPGLLVLIAILVVSVLVANFISFQISRLANAVSNDMLYEHERHSTLPKEIKDLVTRIGGLMKNSQQRSRDAMELSAQVVHDLGSPISVLGVAPAMFVDATKGCNVCTIAIADPLQALTIATKSVQQVSTTLLRQRRYLHDLTSVRNAVLESVTLLRLKYPSRKIELDFATASEGPMVEGFSRIVVNLIVNAIEASSQMSSVIVTFDEDQFEFRVSILDFGDGIHHDTLQKIYAGQMVTTKAEGSGLGLASMLDWVNKQSYRQQIVSLPGSGTTVTIFFPKPTRAPLCNA